MLDALFKGFTIGAILTALFLVMHHVQEGAKSAKQHRDEVAEDERMLLQEALAVLDAHYRVESEQTELLKKLVEAHR